MLRLFSQSLKRFFAGLTVVYQLPLSRLGISFEEPTTETFNVCNDAIGNHSLFSLKLRREIYLVRQ